MFSKKPRTRGSLILKVFQKTQNQRFFEIFKKPETVGALILRVFKNPEPEVL